jgi:hypothetical protein
MVRYVSPSEFQRLCRDLEQKRRQAIDQYNQQVRRHNENVKRSIDNYNREVRAHNDRVRAYRQRMQSALTSLSRQPVVTRYVVFRTSVQKLSSAYVSLESRGDASLGPAYNRVLDLSERETSNSVDVANALLGSPPDPEPSSDGLEDAQLTDELRRISDDLDDRWRGAVFALNPRNPDAARHFCTSAREIITQILETKAPDIVVIEAMPDCARTEQGKPTRRAKVKFFLHRKGMVEETLEEFVEQDMQNIVELFGIFNDGTHGTAGTFDMQTLSVIRKRVEEGIFFLSRLID